MPADDAEHDATLLGRRRDGPGPAVPEGGPATVLGRRQRSATVAAAAAPGAIRFGPGVAVVVEAAAQVQDAPETSRRRRPRWASALWVLAIAVVAVLLWLWLHPRHALVVSTVQVTVTPKTIGCGESAQLRAVVATNSGRGTITYRWRRGDGPPGPVMEYRVGDGGPHRAVLPLHWRIQGTGAMTGVATVELITPNRLQASATFGYVCR